jgi:hypothetical protein
MAYEPPHMPTEDEIYARALQIFHEANPQLPTITPEKDELIEGSYWTRAHNELMSGIRAALEQYLSQLESEADRVREELGVEKPLPTDERLTELENQLANVERRYNAAKDQLKAAEGEIRKIHEAKPPAPPLPPPRPPMGLTEEQKALLEDLFKSTFIEAGASYTGRMAEFRTELERLQQDLKDVPRDRAYDLAQRAITDLAKTLIPYKPPTIPIPTPITAVPVRVALPQVRVREVRSEICLVCRRQHMIDVDLIRRVSEGSDEILGVGRVRHVEPVLKFPYSFYHMCPDCRYAQFGYRDIYDALAYLLAEGRRSEYKKVKVTKDTLRAIGLDETDLNEIQAIEERYRTTS